MTILSDNDLKELKDLIISQNKKIDQLVRDTTDIKINIAELKGELKENIAELRGDIKALNENVKGLDKRVEKIENSQNTVVKDVADLKGAKSLIIPIIVAVTTSLLMLLIRAIPNP